MNEIIRHIEFLLVSHDCVIIPGFGAVLAHSLSARYDKSSDVLLPPSRTFSFNKSLNHNDGLLVSSIARSKGISFEAAASVVSVEVETMRRQLEIEGLLSLGLAGKLVMSEGVMSFEPSSAASLSPEFMWLPSLRLTDVAALAKRREALLQSSDGRQSRRTFKEYAIGVARIAASLAILIALGFVLSTPVAVENAQYASLGIENFAPAANHSEPEQSIVEMPGRAKAGIILYLQAHDDACERVDTAAHSQYIRQREAMKLSAGGADAMVSQSGPRFNPADRYYLIVASLANEAEADKFIANSKYDRLGVLVKDGRYRVYAATGETISQTQDAAAMIEDRFPSTWVCRK